VQIQEYNSSPATTGPCGTQRFGASSIALGHVFNQLQMRS
jgi:hypothetical protein